MPLSLQEKTPPPVVAHPRLEGLPDGPLRRNLRGLLWPLGLLTAGLVAIIAVLLLFAAREQNELALVSSRHLAENAVATQVAEVVGYAREYATWDDTVRNVVHSLDETWADQNIGSWAYDSLGLDATLVVAGESRPVYAMIGGERLDGDMLARIGDGLDPLVAAARAAEPSSQGAVVSGFLRLDGRIAIAAAGQIVWSDGSPAAGSGEVPSVLIYLRSFDAEMLTELEQGFLLSGLRIVDGQPAASAADTPGAASQPLRSHDGRILGHLVWTAERPGFRMLRPLVLPGTLAALLAGLLLWMVIRRASRAMHELSESHTVLREHAEALREARDRAERQTRSEVSLRQRADASSRSKSEFLALVSHELRTPLNAILGFSETISTQAFGPAVSERYREYAGDIHESGSHLLSIINDILDLSKIEAGRYELHEEVVDLSGLLQRCAALLRERAGSKGLVLACGETDIRLRADARALKQIVINLLSNAIKFTEPGGRIELDARDVPQGIEILVADNGIGMNAEDLERALLPFGQAASALTRSEEGTGLGLNITKAFTEMHGGQFIMNSAPGRGTTAIIRLPRERLAAAAPAEKAVGT